MNVASFPQLCLAAFGFWLGVVSVARTAAPTERPNIIFILADDLRWDALGCFDNPIVQTPNLDRLAQGGVRFRNCRVTTSICCVSRASIFSGQYARRHEISEFTTAFTETQWAKTYPALLRRNGYRTGFIGKFGVGDNAYVQSRASEFDFWRGRPGQGGLFFEKDDATQTHATTRMGDEALEFLAGGERAKPFCLSLSFTAPHARDGEVREFMPDARDENIYADALIPVPKTASDEYFSRLPVAVQQSEGRRRWKRRFATPEMFQQTVKDYYRLITGIDREVGRIVAELAARGMAEQTVIIFTSDNGFFFGERGLADKWFIYEESIRVPLLVFDPRLPQNDWGRRVNAMGLNIDLAPTMLELAGVTIPPETQGRSLVPWLRKASEPAQWRSQFLYEHHTVARLVPPSEGVVTERWKYVQWIGQPQPNEELYDLSADALEEQNVAGSPASFEILDTLRSEHEALCRELR